MQSATAVDEDHGGSRTVGVRQVPGETRLQQGAQIGKATLLDIQGIPVIGPGAGHAHGQRQGEGNRDVTAEFFHRREILNQ